MNKNDILISVIMNCHNGEKFFEKSVKSVLDQSYKNWELIFWDNKSTDNSKKIIKILKTIELNIFIANIFLHCTNQEI